MYTNYQYCLKAYYNYDDMGGITFNHIVTVFNSRIMENQQMMTGEQGWCSGESTRLPPMWPGFDSPIRHLMSTEFVGSLSCSERFFSGYSGFPLSPKTNISPTRPHKLTALNCIPCINKVSLPFFFTFT